MRRARPGRSTHRARGFGLLEAIVALVLLAGSGAALFAWINQNLASASRLQLVQREATLSLAAQALTQHVDPAREPTGQRALADLEVRWNSQVVHPLRDGAAFVVGQPSNWQLGLYRVTVAAQDRATGTKVDFTVLKLGTQPRAGFATRDNP